MERIFIDQMNTAIRLEGIPRRIVSLVPSQTELLFDLGLNDEVVGITKFCIYPTHWFQSKKRIGGTKQLNISAIRELQPDLIIGNKEENTKEDILALKEIAPVWMSDIYTVEEALDMLNQVGELVGKKEVAENLVGEIVSGMNSINCKKSPTFLYFIWKNPDYLAGQQTFIHSMLEQFGWRNFCQSERYPEYQDEIGEPDYVLLSSEPYPFKNEHVSEFEKRFPKAKVRLIDGEMCSWYGSRMKLAPVYFKSFFEKEKLI